MALWDGVDAPLLTGHTPCAAATTVGAVSASSSSFWKSPAPQPWCLVLQESFPLSQAPSGSSGGAAPQSEDARWTHWSTGHSMPQPHESLSRRPGKQASADAQHKEGVSLRTNSQVWASREFLPPQKHSSTPSCPQMKHNRLSCEHTS